MSVSYEDALSTLTAMFGAPWTEDNLDDVLRYHNGNMENTCESVLSHGDEKPEILLNSLERSRLEKIERVAMDEKLAQKLSQQDEGADDSEIDQEYSHFPLPKRGTPTGFKPNFQRGTPTELEPDFLRIPNRNGLLEGDTALAQMLQDELFAQELKNNPDLAHLASSNTQTWNDLPSNQQHHQSRPSSAFPGLKRGDSYTERGQSNNQNSGGLVEALSGLGDSAKSKLTLLAVRFKNKTNRNGNGTQGGIGGRNSLGEYTGLLGEDDEEIDFEMKQVALPGGSKKFD